MTVKYLKLFWYKVSVHSKLKLLDFLTDFVLIFFRYKVTLPATVIMMLKATLPWYGLTSDIFVASTVNRRSFLILGRKRDALRVSC